MCPVAAKVGKKRNRITIAGVDGTTISKKGPKTGVELRYYTSKEYGKLSKEEMVELKELRPAKKGKNKQQEKPEKGKQGVQLSRKALKKRIKGQVAAALKHQRRDNQDKSDSEEIRSILNETESYNAANATASSAAVKLNSVLKKRRGN